MKRIGLLLLAVTTALILAACDGALPDITYDLDATGATLSDGTTVSNVSGTAMFEKVSDTETRITLDLVNTVPGIEHPAHIHIGDTTDNGAIYVSLTPVDGDTGMSVTTVTQTDAGTAVSYEDLIAFDGYINVHESASALGVVVANGEVGLGVAGN